MAIIDMRTYSFWVLIYKAPSIPGQWIAHALEFDVVTQGDSPTHAAEMSREAVAMTIADDLNEGLDPERRRRTTPDKDWEQLRELVLKGTRLADPVDIGRETEEARASDGDYIFAVQLALDFVKHDRREDAASTGDVPPLSVLRMPNEAVAAC